MNHCRHESRERGDLVPSCPILVGHTEPVVVVADGHVHSEWSWDARLGWMDATCARAVQVGLPAVAFTEHVDLTPFRAGFLEESLRPLVWDGVLTAPRLGGGYAGPT